MESFATDPSFWGWLRNIAETSMMLRIGLLIIGSVFFIVVLAIGINLFGKNVLGRDDLLLPAILKWFGRVMIRWFPILRGRLQVYLAKPKQPRPPLTKKQRILATIYLCIYFVISLALIWFSYGPNALVNAYGTDGGGILVEVQARRQPTDGFQFTIQFDHPAQVIGVWTDIPIYKQQLKQFNIHTNEIVNFQDNRIGTQNIVFANYPIATPQKSVFLYFQPSDPEIQQLKVININSQTK